MSKRKLPFNGTCIAIVGIAAALDVILLASAPSWIAAAFAAVGLCGTGLGLLATRSAWSEWRGLVDSTKRESEQIATRTETLAPPPEATSLTSENVVRMPAAAEMAGETDRLVDDADCNLEAMAASVKEIDATISTIDRVIGELAFQTDILALNAAVEAAHAGEAGVNFAIVSDEPSKLEQRSAHSSHEVALLTDVAESVRKIMGGAAPVKALVNKAAARETEHVTPGRAAAMAAEEMASHAKSLGALLESLRGASGASAGVASPAFNRSPPSSKAPAEFPGFVSASAAFVSVRRQRSAEVPIDENDDLS